MIWKRLENVYLWMSVPFSIETPESPGICSFWNDKSWKIWAMKCASLLVEENIFGEQHATISSVVPREDLFLNHLSFPWLWFLGQQSYPLSLCDLRACNTWNSTPLWTVGAQTGEVTGPGPLTSNPLLFHGLQVIFSLLMIREREPKVKLKERNTSEKSYAINAFTLQNSVRWGTVL